MTMIDFRCVTELDSVFIIKLIRDNHLVRWSVDKTFYAKSVEDVCKEHNLPFIPFESLGKKIKDLLGDQKFYE